MHCCRRKILIVILLSIGLCACGNSNCLPDRFSFDDCTNEDSKGKWQEIEFVRVESTTRFDDGNWGHHLFYFPGFNISGGEKVELDTDDRAVVEVNRDFDDLVHFDDVQKRQLSKLDNRTFSFDDFLDKDEVGAKTAGGFDDWPIFYLPEDNDGNYRVGRSGVVYDPKTRDSNNNIVNQLKIRSADLHSFCLNLVTDNTNRMYDPNDNIVARSDRDLAEAKVPASILTERFSEEPPVTDVYTFRYTGFKREDRIKIRIRATKDQRDGGGFGGIMVSDINTCCEVSCALENECGGNNGCGDPCPCTKNEMHVTDMLVPSVVDDFNEIDREQSYYIRGVYTRQVLTLDTYSGALVMRPRRNLKNQQWIFAGECQTDRECEGQFINKLTGQCLTSGEDSRIAGVEGGECQVKGLEWTLRDIGRDEVLGGRKFSGAKKYSIRYTASNNDYLVAKATEEEARLAKNKLETSNPSEIDSKKLEFRVNGGVVRTEDRSSPDRPWDHWVLEFALPEEMPID